MAHRFRPGPLEVPILVGLVSDLPEDAERTDYPVLC